MYLTEYDIERIAAKVIDEYRRVIKKDDLRVNPMRLAEEVLNLEVDFAHLSLDRTIYGLATFENFTIEVYDDFDRSYEYALSDRTILIEKDLQRAESMKGRMNFTIAHECAHHILNNLVSNKQDHDTAAVWQEWQAENLASAILMPYDAICKGMWYFGFGKKIGTLNPVYNPFDYQKFKMLADYLGASVKALSIRMIKCGLLEEIIMDNPAGAIIVQGA